MITCHLGHEKRKRAGRGYYCPTCQNGASRKRRGFVRPTAAERFWAKVQQADPFECWLWTGAKDRGGYGKFSRAGRGVSAAMAHRWSYEHLIGEIPAGLQLDHLCRTPACVNPWHLEPVTREENLARTRGIAQPGKRGPRGPQKNPRRSRAESITTTATL